MERFRRRLWFAVLIVVTITPLASAAASPQRRPATKTQVAKSVPSVITLEVDAREAPRRLFHARLSMPVTPGPLELLYPKWIPGEHGPTGPIVDLAGLKFTAGGKPLAWRRDPLEMYTLHLDVPAGATTLDISLDYLSPTTASGFSAGASATANLALISWNHVVLYPAGFRADQLQYRASLRLPAGWKLGTALPVANQADGAVEFAPAPLTTLVDSPVLAGLYFKSVDLSPGQNPPHQLHMAADSTAALDVPQDVINSYKQLIIEAGALFGARHYRAYHFLLTLSNSVAHFGLEHHESSDDRIGERGLVDDSERRLNATLLPHEFVHSWNGKYRRPADLTTPDYQAPMQTTMLWVYEGLTQYLGNLLAVRSGLWTPTHYREHLAEVAAEYSHRPGREWRSLQDTATAAQVLYEAPQQWSSWRRGVDFYDEGALIWLEADVLIRQQTQGRRSLDDFCRLFYGGENSPPAVKTYTFDDLVATMNQVAPMDWRGFFTTRLNATGSQAPLGGVEGGGWRVMYDETQGELLKANEQVRKITDASFSLGITVQEDGRIPTTIFGMPAAQAGMAPGMTLIGVNNRHWSPQVLHDALKAKQPVELLVDNGDFFHNYRIDYKGGERYPHLERDSNKPDLLEQIIKPLAPTAVKGDDD
jgi:predicted metalloprotease with PDZ domain